VGPADDRAPVQLELDRHHGDLVALHSLHHDTSWRKCFRTERTGLGAACPSPQIEASIIACESSLRSASSHLPPSMRSSALAVPTRQGVHWPQDSCLKKPIRFLAASEALSLSEKMTMAAEPMKQPCGWSVSKSSGMSPLEAGRMPPEAPPGRQP